MCTVATRKKSSGLKINLFMLVLIWLNEIAPDSRQIVRF